MKEVKPTNKPYHNEAVMTDTTSLDMISHMPPYSLRRFNKENVQTYMHKIVDVDMNKMKVPTNTVEAIFLSRTTSKSNTPESVFEKLK